MPKYTLKPLAVGIVAGSVLLTGCMGNFALTKQLYGWNKHAANDRWVNEFIFAGFTVILPVYGLSLLADGIIFNSVQWWTGKNPVAAAGDQQRVIGADGSEALMTLRGDGAIDVDAVSASGERRSFTLVRAGDEVAVLDANGLPAGVTSL